MTLLFTAVLLRPCEKAAASSSSQEVVPTGTHAALSPSCMFVPEKVTTCAVLVLPTVREGPLMVLSGGTMTLPGAAGVGGGGDGG